MPRFSPRLALAALAACIPLVTFSVEPIPVGQVASLTGNRSAYGVSSDKGTRLALAEINAAGGVLGRPIRLITEDNQSKPGEPAAAAKKLIGGDKVVVLLGEVTSSASLEMAAVAQAAGIPMISPSATHPAVTETGDHIFRVSYLDSFQGVVLAKFSLNNLKAKRVAILRDESSDYSRGLADFFKAHFLKTGGEIAAERSYKARDVDFRAQLIAIRAAKPDAILIPGHYEEAGLIVKQARRLGLKQPLFGGGGWGSPAIFDIAGKDLEGCYITCQFSADDPSPSVQNFVKTYRARYNEIPDAGAALGYDSLKVAADAITRAGGTDPAKLCEAIGATKNFPGATGTITLDAKRNAAKPALILKARDGVFRHEATVAP